jgi:hypothetical protein
MMKSIGPSHIELDPIEMDSPTCEQCGCTIEELEDLIYLRVADLVTEWELGDPRDRWKHTGEPAPSVTVRNSDLETQPSSARPYCTSQSVIDAFMYVARNHDAAYLARWLANHPQDVETLTKLWETKNGIS